MPSNLKDYMQRQSRNSSMVDSEHSIIQHHNHSNKFQMSREECINQMTKLIEKLADRDDKVKEYSQKGINEALRKFEEDYNTLSKQIIKHVELYLRENKERLIKQISDRRNVEVVEVVSTKRNIEKLRGEIIMLREGLHKQNQYREYISKIVRRDFDFDLGQINEQIKKLRFPMVNLSINEHHYSGFKAELSKVIVVEDQFGRNIERTRPNSGTTSQINMHSNRDQIKKVC